MSIKITAKKTKTGARITFRATTAESRVDLAKLVMSGDLMRALNGEKDPKKK